MTKEEAINELNVIKYCEIDNIRQIEAIDMAISVLESSICHNNKKTKRDFLNAMTNEELATWICEKAISIMLNYTDGRLGMIEYLGQPAKEE